MKSLHTFNCASMCLSMFLLVNSYRRSYLFFFTRDITGVKKTRDIIREHEAAISKYRKIDILYCLLVSDSSIIASVELFNAAKTLFRQFLITKYVVGWLSEIELIGSVEILNALTTISIIASQILNI